MADSGIGRTREVFEAVADLDSEEREERLLELCGDDADLLQRVRSLLGAEEQRNPILRALDRLIGAPPEDDEDDENGVDPADPYGLIGGAVGPYQVLGRLGGGGMGVVYRAHDLDLDRTVALKFLPPHASQDEEALERFVREARAASALDHPAICTIHTIDRTPSGAVFIVMACYEGESLRERIARGPIPWQRAVDLALQAASGLQRAHEAGIVHRDIKPANLVLTSRGELKILDFGIALILGDDRVTRSGELVGTAAYMSPEQVRGHEVDGRTDIWSLGVVLYEMLAGERPFGGDHPLVVFHAILRQDRARLSELGVEVPQALEAILDRALSRELSDRYENAEALSADLKATLGDGRETVYARPRREEPCPAGLPTPLTSFVGREEELAKVRELLGSSRLVTLIGPAGAGKTRLAVETAARSSSDFRDGACFVALAPITDPELVPSVIASAIGIKEDAGTSPLDSLIEHLRQRQMLLVLDNLEQIISAAPVVADLLSACPQLRILATSRTVLRVSGEQEYRVPPLPLPDPDQPDLPDVIDDFPATALFLTRARSVEPDLTPGPEDARAIAEICRRLDGLPLAIELAAARIRMLSPQAIVGRLGHRLDLLGQGPRDRAARHRTLRGAIAWSYDLLQPAERTLYRRLSVFSGGCSLEAAESVASPSATTGEAAHEEGAPADQASLLDTLAALVDHSLIRKGGGPHGAPRFWMLETIREFGLERLAEAGEEETFRRAHAEYFLDLAERARPKLIGPEQGDWVARLAVDHDNLRAAMDWAEEGGHAELGLRLGTALWRFWAIRGHLREGRQRLERLSALPGAEEPTAERAAALCGLGTLVHETGDFIAALQPLEDSLEMYRALDDHQGIATVLNNLGWVRVWLSGVEEARAVNEEAVELNRELGDRRGLALALNNLGWLAQLHGQFAEAVAHHERSLELREELGDERGQAFALINRSWADRHQGRVDLAERSLREALSILHRVGERQILGWGQAQLAHVELERGQISQAIERFEESVEIQRRSGNRAGAAWSTLGLAMARLEAGDHEGAEGPLFESIRGWQATSSPRGQALADCTLVRLRREQGDHSAARDAAAEGLALSRRADDRYVLARLFEELAHLLVEEGSFRAAARMVGAVEALRGEMGSPRPPISQTAWRRMVERCRERLEEDVFAEARAYGEGLSAAEATELADRILKGLADDAEAGGPRSGRSADSGEG